MANKGSLFEGVLENSVNVGTRSNLKNAIENAGIVVPADAGLWEYPEIIRKNLVSKTVTGINIAGRDVINIDVSSDGEVVKYDISTAFDTYGVPRPNYAKGNYKWGDVITVEDICNDLFNNILPAVRGVHSGDMTVTNINGEDTQEWYHPLFNKRGVKKGLEQTSRYIRLYLTCQAEPIFINMGNMVKEVTNGYNVISSDTVLMTVDDSNNTISAHINVINSDQLNELGITLPEEVIPEIPDVPLVPEIPDNNKDNQETPEIPEIEVNN